LEPSFDYKNRTINNTNIVPIYHALNSRSSGEALRLMILQWDNNEGT
jgi:hypothetical protein